MNIDRIISLSIPKKILAVATINFAVIILAYNAFGPGDVRVLSWISVAISLIGLPVCVGLLFVKSQENRDFRFIVFDILIFYVSSLFGLYTAFG